MLELNIEGCDDNDELGIYFVYVVGIDNFFNKGYIVEMIINGLLCVMEVDIVVDYLIMSKSIYF